MRVARLLAGCAVVASAAIGAGCAKPHVAPSPEIEARLAKLEALFARHREAIEFLDKVYAQQKAQDDNVLAEDGVWAIDINAAVAAHQTEGPADALVTIVEAWDFG